MHHSLVQKALEQHQHLTERAFPEIFQFAHIVYVRFELCANRNAHCLSRQKGLSRQFSEWKKRQLPDKMLAFVGAVHF